jgi:hypothetical protein
LGLFFASYKPIDFKRNPLPIHPLIFYFEIGFFYSSCEMTQGMPRHNNMADTEWSQSVFSPFYQFSTEKMAMAEQLS